MTNVSWCVAAAIAAATTVVTVQPRSSSLPSDDEVRRVLVERVDTDRWAMGIVVGLISPEGRRIVAYGRRAGDSTEPLRGDTVFEIGSVTKVFTSLVLADMVLQEEVSLDDPVDKFLPAGVAVPKRHGRAITLRDLSTHTSGLPRMPPRFAPANPANPYNGYSVSAFYEMLSQITLRHDIGSTYAYSNVGTGLLGHVLALKNGVEFSTLVARRVFAPLGMRDTAFVVTPEMARRVATGHNAQQDSVSAWDVPEAFAGSGGLRSTADDLLTFLSAVLTPGTRFYRATELMLASPRRTADDGLLMGLGWHVRLLEGRKIVYHDGGTGGFRSFLAFDRESGHGVVVLSNTCSEADLNDIGMHFLDRRAVLLSFRPTAPGDPAALDKYVGVYRFGLQDEVAIMRFGALLYAKAPSQPAFIMSLVGPHEFSLRPVDQTRPPYYRPTVPLPRRYTFETDVSGRAVSVQRDDGGRFARGTRVK